MSGNIHQHWEMTRNAADHSRSKWCRIFERHNHQGYSKCGFINTRPVPRTSSGNSGSHQERASRTLDCYLIFVFKVLDHKKPRTQTTDTITITVTTCASALMDNNVNSSAKQAEWKLTSCGTLQTHSVFGMFESGGCYMSQESVQATFMKTWEKTSVKTEVCFQDLQIYDVYLNDVLFCTDWPDVLYNTRCML